MRVGNSETLLMARRWKLIIESRKPGFPSAAGRDLEKTVRAESALKINPLRSQRLR